MAQTRPLRTGSQRNRGLNLIASAFGKSVRMLSCSAG